VDVPSGLLLGPAHLATTQQFLRRQIGHFAESSDQMALLDFETPETVIGGIDVFRDFRVAGPDSGRGPRFFSVAATFPVTVRRPA
jgi:hypothetical protein